jgi:SAM-dependent methyltransferase
MRCCSQLGRTPVMLSGRTRRSDAALRVSAGKTRRQDAHGRRTIATVARVRLGPAGVQRAGCGSKGAIRWGTYCFDSFRPCRGEAITYAFAMSAEARQRAYYERTAVAYDEAHDEPEHKFALGHVVRFLDWLGARSLLDTGCGTGRALRYIGQELPHLELRGNDPSAALVEVAAQRGVPRDRLDICSSEQLPYSNESFDAVAAFAVMHHVPDPASIVLEMLRVARLAVFISDANIYGQGSMPARLVKLGLSRAHLLTPFNWVRRGGKVWHESEGDGVAYSYSVFDSLPLLMHACEQVLVIPTSGGPQAGRAPLLHAPYVLACGFKVPLPT